MNTPVRILALTGLALVGASLNAAAISGTSYTNDFTSSASDFTTTNPAGSGWVLNTTTPGYFGHNDAGTVIGTYTASVQQTLLGGSVATASGFTFSSTVDYTASGVASSNRLGVMLLASDSSLTPTTSYSFYLRGVASGGFSAFLARNDVVVASAGDANNELRDYFGTSFTYDVAASYVDNVGSDGINDALSISLTLTNPSKSSTISLTYVDSSPLTGNFFGLLAKDDSGTHTLDAQWDSVSLTVASIPEPATASLLAGFVGLGLARFVRRRRDH